MHIMKLALLALPALLAAVTPGLADPMPACKAEGKDLFAVDHRASGKQPTSTVTVKENGSWLEVAKSADGKLLGEKKGCLEKTTLIKLASLIKTSPWTVTQKRINCKLMATTWIVDSANGKEVFTERACGKDRLDDASAKNLVEIHAILDGLATSK